MTLHLVHESDKLASLTQKADVLGFAVVKALSVVLSV